MAKKDTWRVGDIFEIPLTDKSFGHGQVLGIERDNMNSLVAGFFDYRSTDTKRDGDFISVLFVTRDLLDSGRWKVVSNRPAPQPEVFLPLASLRSNGYVGSKVIGSANVQYLLSAYFGLIPWNMMHDPNYFDGLLLPGRQRPANLILK